MVIALAFLAAFAALVWLGRRSRRGKGDWRVASSLITVATFVGATLAFARGEWPMGIVLAVVGLFLMFDVRGRGARAQPQMREQYRPRQPPPEPEAGMSDAQAREILGVSRTAGPKEIQAAYLRLMRALHPDHGGSPALAAQINAARDRLAGKS
jgi:hypothetical protein